MADKKISQLTDGTSFQTGDEAVVNRGGVNYKIDPTQFGSSIDVAGTVTADGLTVDTDTGITLKDGADTRTANLFLDGGAFQQYVTGSADIHFYSTDSKTLRMAITGNTGDISFYEDTGTTAKFFWDASAESLGIGTTSPQLAPLHIATSSTYSINLQNDASNESGLIFSRNGSPTASSTAIVGNGETTGYLKFVSGGSEAMRIDSSGNLLVGTTTTTAGNEGLVYFSGSSLRITRDAGEPLNLDRLTSDGDIAIFRKDGTEVGSIGTRSARLNIGEGDTGLEFHGGLDAIFPFDPSTNSLRDNAIDLGNSTNRFKNLYLSGGVYLGGTGAANLLDDYETGTWTPVIVGGTTAGTGTYTAQEGIYTKVGNLVTVTCWLDWSAHTGTGTFQVGGLPFSSSAAVNLQTGSTYASSFDAGTSATQLIAYVSGSTSMLFRGFVNNATRAVTNINSSGQLGVTISYRAA